MTTINVLTAADLGEEFEVRDNKVHLVGASQSSFGLTDEKKAANLISNVNVIYTKTTDNRWVVTDQTVHPKNFTQYDYAMGDRGPWKVLPTLNDSQMYQNVGNPHEQPGELELELPQSGGYPVLADPKVAVRYNTTNVAWNMSGSYLGGEAFKKYYEAGGKIYILFNTSEYPDAAHYLANWELGEYNRIIAVGNNDFTQTSYNGVNLNPEAEPKIAFDMGRTVTFYFSTGKEKPELSEDGTVCILDLGGEYGKVGIPISVVKPATADTPKEEINSVSM